MGADANGLAYALDNRYNSVNPLAFWSGVIFYYPWIDSRLTRSSNYSHHRAPRQWRPHDLALAKDATKRVPTKRSGRAKFHLGLVAARTPKLRTPSAPIRKGPDLRLGTAMGTTLLTSDGYKTTKDAEQ